MGKTVFTNKTIVRHTKKQGYWQSWLIVKIQSRLADAYAKEREEESLDSERGPQAS